MASDSADRAPLISVDRLAQLLGVQKVDTVQRPDTAQAEHAAGRAPRSGAAAAMAPVTLLDVRWSLSGPPGRDEYAAGHIPSARFVDLDHQLAAPHVPGDAGGRHPLPNAEDFQAVMRSLGVSDDRTVVVYDAAAATSAARAWWLLRYFSHSDVRVLDGGYAAWTAAGMPVVSGTDPNASGLGGGPGAGDFIAVPGAMPLLDAD